MDPSGGMIPPLNLSSGPSQAQGGATSVMGGAMGDFSFKSAASSTAPMGIGQYVMIAGLMGLAAWAIWKN